MGFLTLSVEKPLSRLNQKSKTAGFKNVHKSALRPHVQFDMLAADGGGDGRIDLDVTDAEDGPSEHSSSEDEADAPLLARPMFLPPAGDAATAASSSDRVVGSGIARNMFYMLTSAWTPTSVISGHRV